MSIIFHTGNIATRAGNGVVADGGGIYVNNNVPDLVILIADATDIIKSYPPKNSESGVISASSTSVSVKFTGLSQGTYTVYAFANTEGLWDMETGGTPVTDLTDLDTKTEVDNLQFSSLGANVTPVLKNGRLPMSAKGTLEVSSSGNGMISLELIRCVAKVTMTFENNTAAALKLEDFGFSLQYLNPNKGYVTPVALPTVPAGVNYGSIVKSGITDEASSYVSFNAGERKSYDFFVFPGVAPSPGKQYLLGAHFYANDSADESTFSNLPVHNDHAVDITSLERNQHLKIVTRISLGLTVSFNFEVSGWDEKEESVSFE